MRTPTVRAIRHRAKEVVLSHVPGIYWRYFDARFGEDGIEAEMPLLPILADRSKIAVDIGASYGIYTHMLLPCARLVHAFEPQPRVAAVLARVYQRDPQVVVHQVALSDTAGVVDMRIPAVHDPNEQRATVGRGRSSADRQRGGAGRTPRRL